MTNEIITRGALVPIIGALGDVRASVLEALAQVEICDNGVEYHGLAEAAGLSYGFDVGSRAGRHPMAGVLERPEAVRSLFLPQKIPPFGVFSLHTAREKLSNYARFCSTIIPFW